MSAVQDALSNPDGKHIDYHLDIYQNGQLTEIIGRHAWEAVNDPAIADDVNIRTDDNGLTIAAAPYYTPPSHFGSDIRRACSRYWNLQVYDDYDNGPWYNPSYNHKGTIRTIIGDAATVNRFGFVAPYSMMLDNVDVMLEFRVELVGLINNGAAERARIKAPMAKYLYADISIQDEGGNIIGTSVAAGGLEGFNHYKASGFKAQLIASKRYFVVVAFRKPVASDFPYSREAQSYNISLDGRCYVYPEIDSPNNVLFVPVSANFGFEFGGQKNFLQNGTAWRTISLDESPTDIQYSIKDKVPTVNGGTLSVRLYSTNDDALAAIAGITGWIDQGLVSDGDTITTTDRHFRLRFDLTATTNQYDAPFIEYISVNAAGSPLVYSTSTEIIYDTNGIMLARSIPTLSKVNYSLGAISQDAISAIDGKTTCSILGDNRSGDLFSLPPKARCRLRTSVRGVEGSDIITQGEIEDIKVRDGYVDVVFIDSASIGKDAKVPQHKHPTYDPNKTYNAGDTCSLNAVGYRANTTVTGIAPPSAEWNNIGTVWVNKLYPSGTHLVDIALDIIQNEVNIPDRFIHHSSFGIIKNMYPARTITSTLIFDKQISTKDLTNQIAILLESYWTRIDGKLALVPDGRIQDGSTATINANDISKVTAGLQLQSEVNTVIIANGYANGTYNDAVVHVDSALLLKHKNRIIVKQLNDRFGLPIAELETVAANYVARRNGGRLRVKCDRHIKHNKLNNGDVVTLELSSTNVNEAIAGTRTMMVEQNVPRGDSGSITMIEVKV